MTFRPVFSVYPLFLRRSCFNWRIFHAHWRRGRKHGAKSVGNNPRKTNSSPFQGRCNDWWGIRLSTAADNGRSVINGYTSTGNRLNRSYSQDAVHGAGVVCTLVIGIEWLETAKQATWVWVWVSTHRPPSRTPRSFHEA
jgi:hypothetical protein